VKLIYFPLKKILRPGNTFFKAFLKDYFAILKLERKMEKRREKLGKKNKEASF
jgi:hypothetical protein